MVEFGGAFKYRYGFVAKPGPLRFDPIDEARRQWQSHGWSDAASGMAAVTSIVRGNRIFVARIDALLRPYEITFARFELLTLLSFAKAEGLPMNKIGIRLQVHPTSVTSIVDRLEAQGFVGRLSHATDRRTTLIKILPPGHAVLKATTRLLNEQVFAQTGLTERELEKLIALLRKLRIVEGDFEG
jgi:DNA-binding MarR family transcriptional regulator